MIEELEYYTDTLRIQELDEDAAQALYNTGMEFALTLAAVKSLSPAEAAENQRESLRYAIAAEEFAYAYYKQNGEILDGAADPVADYELEHTPPWAPKPVLTDAELRSRVLTYLRRTLPLGLSVEFRFGD